MILASIAAGSTDQSIRFRIIDGTTGLPDETLVHNSAGVDFQYRRGANGAAVPMTLVTLATISTAHTDYGFIHIDKGWYRLDMPDAAFTSGVDDVEITGAFTGKIVITGVVELLPGAKDTFARQNQINYRLQLDGTQSAPSSGNAASNLLVTTDILSSGAENQINAQVDTSIEDYRLDELIFTTAGTAAANSLWSDLLASASTPPTNWSSMQITSEGIVVSNATNQPSIALTTTVATIVLGNSQWTTVAGSATDDVYNGMRVRITDAGNSSNVYEGTVSDYVGSTRTFTVTLDDAFSGLWIVAPGDRIEVLNSGMTTVDVDAIADAVLREAVADHSGQAGSLAETVANTLVDTADLQANQGNWLTATGFSTHDAAAVVTALGDGSSLTTCLTATGFSTHSAADVYTEFTSSTNADAFKADVNGLSTFDPATDPVSVNRVLGVTLTETTAGNLASNFSTFYDNNDTLTIKVVDSVGSGAGGGDDAATIYSYFTTSGRQETFKATGFSTHNASDVYTEFTSGSNEDMFKADVTGIEADLVLIKGPTFNTNTDSLEAIRNQGDAAWTGSEGAGTFSYSDTVTNSVSGDPIQGADVFYTAVGGTTVISSTSTNILGEYTLFADSAGPFDVTIYKRGFVAQTLSSVTFTEA